MNDPTNYLINSADREPKRFRGVASEDQRSQFLQLLIAQLKGQDPMNPVEGTEFVTQLAQFSSLEELIGIREVMEKVEQHPDPSGGHRLCRLQCRRILCVNENPIK